ncbi:MAG TPA: hypothetical protein VKI62_04535, partial [Bacteroidota bacterium]|nr:hypothetical protein [Bacteroidota bacterium]
ATSVVQTDQKCARTWILESSKGDKRRVALIGIQSYALRTWSASALQMNCNVVCILYSQSVLRI